jgi:NAD(P)-dependent dehydrogenase (short-subunit alcohol dehydrogenase family)
MDVLDSTSVERAVQSYVARNLPPIRYIIHNQGISEGDSKPRKWRPDVAKLVIDVNWVGTKVVQKAFGAHMVSVKEPHHILFVSSDHGQLKNIMDLTWREILRKEDVTIEELDTLMEKYLTWAEKTGTTKQPKFATSAYALTKVALVQYARILARDVPGLIVNAVHPGYIRTIHNGWRGKMTPEWASAYILKTCYLRNVTGKFLHKASLFSVEK